MDTQLVVISTLERDGERFFVIDFDARRDFATLMAPAPVEPADRMAFFRERWTEYLHTHPTLSEGDARMTLTDRGLSAADIDEKIVKARQFREWAPETSWNRLTEIGYRNDHRQTVIRRTDRFGATPFQRVYVLRCDECAHEHDVDGCDIHAARCPQCRKESGTGDQDSGLG